MSKVFFLDNGKVEIKCSLNPIIRLYYTLQNQFFNFMKMLLTELKLYIMTANKAKNVKQKRKI